MGPASLGEGLWFPASGVLSAPSHTPAGPEFRAEGEGPHNYRSSERPPPRQASRALGSAPTLNADEGAATTHTACYLQSIFRTTPISPLMGEGPREAQERGWGSWAKPCVSLSDTQPSCPVLTDAGISSPQAQMGTPSFSGALHPASGLRPGGPCPRPVCLRGVREPHPPGTSCGVRTSHGMSCVPVVAVTSPGPEGEAGPARCLGKAPTSAPWTEAHAATWTGIGSLGTGLTNRPEERAPQGGWLGAQTVRTPMRGSTRLSALLSSAWDSHVWPVSEAQRTFSTPPAALCHAGRGPPPCFSRPGLASPSCEAPRESHEPR